MVSRDRGFDAARLIPEGAGVTPFRRKMAELNPDGVSGDWYDRASRVLRGGDGGEHGLILHGLTRQRAGGPRPLTVLDVGTARGFSAVAMARAMLDAGAGGRVHSVDVIDHREPRNWHGDKQDDDEPLAGIEMARSEIWSRWFGDEAERIAPVAARSTDVLGGWKHGPIDVAFLDGGHTYANVKRELDLLDPLMREDGVVILDDYHLGVSVARFRSRPFNVVVRALERALPVPAAISSRPGEYGIVKQRFPGIARAVGEFLAERKNRWFLEIVSMPSRGAYQSGDYSLAVLTRTQGPVGTGAPSP